MGRQNHCIIKEQEASISNGQTYKERVCFQIAIALFTTNGLIAMTLEHWDFENWVQILPENAALGFCQLVSVRTCDPFKLKLKLRVTLLNFPLSKGFTSNYLCR